LSRRRDVNAAKVFLRKAMKGQRVLAKVTLAAHAASHRSVADLKNGKYLNNLVEQDHRRIKQRIGPMLGFNRFD
jgi:transposase-like protein